MVKTTTSFRLKITPIIVLGALIILALIASRFSLIERFQKEKKLSPEAVAEIKANESAYISDVTAMHQEAVTSSRYILEKTSDEEVKSFTDQRIKNATESTWKLISWNQELHGEQFPKASTSQTRVPDLTAYSGKDLERVYLQAMLDSDREVVTRSKSLILVTQEDSLKQLASDLVIEKEKDIEKLKLWIEKYQK